ncbi:MAG TPA: CHAT domain-containing protein [Geobacteraceae bacterium]|nr:CHAT domain-containing protein [Geobacteraceae bacterium]
MDLIKTILNRPDLPYIQKDKISKIDFHCQQYGSAEKSSGIPPFPYNKDVVKVGIYCQPKQQILFNSEETHVSEKILAIDQDFCEVAVNVLNDDRWRERTKYHGEDLYRKLIIDHPEILRAYTEHKSNRKDSDVRLCFQSDLDFFRIPFEFLYDRYGPDRFLVTTHPLSRRVLMNASYKKRAPSPDLFNQFWRQKRTLKVLIIASGADESGCNDEPSLEHVDEEVVTIRKVIEERLITKNIKHKVDHILSKDSDYETVRNLLKTCEYHILHYAGHAFFSERFPEKSYLLFKSGKCGGNPERMSAVALRRLLSDSELKFVYLSCCMGGESTWKYKLNDNQSTGLAVAIAQAGIPSVLGYRGNVNDNSARELAVSFYRSLFDQGSLDKALFDARNEMMEKYADDPIWLSPMLVIQRSG